MLSSAAAVRFAKARPVLLPLCFSYQAVSRQRNGITTLASRSNWATRPTNPSAGANGRPQRFLVMLPPFSAVMIKGHLRSVADQFRQRLDGTAHTAVPVAGKHPMGKRVAAGVTRVALPHRISTPLQFLLDSEEPAHSRHFLPGRTPGVCETGRLPIRLVRFP